MRLGFGPQDWDLGLEAGIWASRLRYGPQSLGEGGTKKEKEEEKIPHMCESIGHRPPRGRCPKRAVYTAALVADGWAGAVEIIIVKE